jgi:hypothetical protein
VNTVRGIEFQVLDIQRAVYIGFCQVDFAFREAVVLQSLNKPDNRGG